jgi:hypothetical protein
MGIRGGRKSQEEVRGEAKEEKRSVRYMVRVCLPSCTQGSFDKQRLVLI